MTESSKPRNSKRNDLQGIRGVAILSVLGFHFYPKLFPNGYLGVDQFFVLSGFLMCMLLTRSQKLPKCTFLTNFYIRRFKRILPLYFLFILCTMVALYTVFPTTAIFLNQMSAGKALIFASNRPHTRDEDYFEKLSIAMDLFTHTWSLSVEIQFYLIVPFIFLLGQQVNGAPKHVYYAVIAAISYIFHFSSPTSISFNSVFARIWQFSIGMVAYFIARKRHVPAERNSKYGEVVGNGEDEQRLLEENRNTEEEISGKSKVLIAKYVILGSAIPSLLSPMEFDSAFGRPLMTVLTGILIVFNEEDKILNSRFLTYLGDISYSLYLIHWPIYAYVRLTFPDGFWILTSALLVSVLVATLTYETYEKWYLKQSDVLAGVLIITFFFSSLLYINKNQVNYGEETVVFESPVQENGFLRKFPRLDKVTANMTFDDAQRMNRYWNIHDHMAPELQEPGCIKISPNHHWCDFKENGTEYKIALLGNSYTGNHHKMIIQECKHRAKSIAMAHETGCEPLAAPRKPVELPRGSSTWIVECPDKLVEFADFINETRPDYAFILSRWFAVGEPFDNDKKDLSKDIIYQEMKSQLKKMLPNIKKKLFILDSFPRIKIDGISKIASDMREGKKTMEEINNALYDSSNFENGRYRHAELVKKECGSKCELINYVDAFWNKTMNAFQYFDSKGFSYFTEGLHISAHGIEHLRPIYSKICAGL